MAKVYASERQMLDELMGTKSGVVEKASDDQAVAIYHEMRAGEGFDETAQTLFDLACRAILTYPKKRRILYLDIEGHRNQYDGFDDDAYEIQRNYVCDFLGKYLHEAHMPLVSWTNDRPSNTMPDSVKIRH